MLVEFFHLGCYKNSTRIGSCTENMCREALSIKPTVIDWECHQGDALCYDVATFSALNKIQEILFERWAL